ncbi:MULTISPECIES: PAS domain-containing protein [unclassified Halorubrum]|uniref:PAS domain-containing protein n=1 Tax=unclassified Halorubrum TaxID=2642239 RepID=UPI000A2DA47A|nr:MULTISPECIES: PAS domain-containing protein [unclassified Halorubrum]OTE99756.1 PAS domain-containing sensor histidine kinase [Halorubrum sp. SD683]OTF10465.1 PAS domain-containing sensor histidine kinase [Halorubrum sp. SD612]
MTLRPSDTSTPDRGGDEGDASATDPPETDDAERAARAETRPETVRTCGAPADRESGTRDGAPPDGGSVEADRFLLAVAVDGEVLFAGPSATDVVGVERDALVGSDLLDRVHPSDRDPVADALSAVTANRTVTHRIRRASGGYAWVESIVDEELAPEFGGRIVTVRRVDVDRTFPERYRAFLEYGSDLVTVVDGDGLVVYESPSVEEVLGYEQGATVGRSPLGYVHPDDRERVTERFYRALDEPNAAPTLEYRYRTADGDWVWLESRTRSLPADSPVGELLVNSRDVTERKARERRLTDRNERLDRFASIVSHDLRNPLSVIRGSIEMARLRGETEPLERGERAVERIDQLVSELLTLARQGTGMDEPTEFALASVARDAWETAAEGDERAELVVAGDAQVYGDRGRMRQALENLFRNAREHATPGAAEAAVDGCEDVPTDGDEEAPASGDDALTVLVTATDEGFLVADDGAGIDPEDRGSVFESGFTTRADGTGYGLDIVREIVESHGWTVELRCDADGPVGLPDGRRLRIPEGACFEVCAPDPADTDPEEPWIDR